MLALKFAAESSKKIIMQTMASPTMTTHEDEYFEVTIVTSVVSGYNTQC